MKKSTKIITIGLVSAGLLASLILIFVIFLPRLQDEEKEINLKDSLKSMVIDFYENEFKTTMPGYLENYGYLKITLDYLQGVDKDIKLFEENSCDYDGTYVELIMDDEGYRSEVILDCKL